MLAGVCNATVRSYTRYGKRHGAVVYLLQYTVCVCVCVVRAVLARLCGSRQD